MDFVRSYFFPNATLTSWTFLDHFCHHFWVGLVLLCCCTHPKVITKMAKKCSTDQSCIKKEVTSYKIHTLAPTSQFLAPNTSQWKGNRKCTKRWLRFFDISKLTGINAIRKPLAYNLWHATKPSGDDAKNNPLMPIAVQIFSGH